MEIADPSNELDNPPQLSRQNYSAGMLLEDDDPLGVASGLLLGYFRGMKFMTASCNRYWDDPTTKDFAGLDGERTLPWFRSAP